MDSNLYTKPYEGIEGVFALPGHIRWLVLPAYPGRTADGEPAIDERVTVVLADKPNRFWPVIVKMSVSDAEQLQAELATAIAERKRRDGVA
jgi:hypothetical protein